MGYIFTNRQEKIIRLLLERDEYINSLSIAEMLEVSDKTIRTDIVMINNQFIIPIIDVQKGRGYYIADKSRCTGYLLGKGNQEGRRELLILKEILSNKSVDYYNLSDSFFISNSTLDKEVYLLNKMIATYYSELQIKRKNNRLLVEGEDRQKRELLAFFLLLELDNNNYEIDHFSVYFKNISISKLKDVIIHYLRDMGVEIVDYSLITLILHIAIIVDRSLNEKDTETEYSEVRIVGDLKCEPLCQEISRFVNHPLPAAEKLNIESLLENIVHLKNMERHEYYLRFLEKILIEITESYNLDIISSDEIKSNFALHMEKLENRCINRQVLKNPLLEEIKNKYSLVYDISVYLAIRFQEIMKYVINEDEIGYIALYILTALEKFQSSKLRIVIINPYTYSISKFIENRLLDKFKNEIDIIKNYSVFDYKEIYKDSPDLILSLVRIYDDIGVPVCKINPFFNDNDFQKVSILIEKITLEKIMQQFTIRNYFSPELFFPQISLETKDEVINFLCNKLKEQAYIGEDFIEQVRLREKMAPTSFNGKYAIPHPARKIAYKNGIAVAILKHPIQWGNNEVKMVLLFSLHSSFNQIPKLYDVLLSKLEQDESFAKMTNVKDFDEFMSIIM